MQFSLNGSAAMDYCSNFSSFVAGTCYIITVTYSVYPAEIKFYINGVLDASYLRGAAPTVVGSVPLSMGSWQGTSRFFGGAFDEVRIWHTTRTGIEKNDIKNCGIPVNAPGLIANYHFNQGTAGSNNAGVTTLNNVVFTVLNGFGIDF